MKHLSIVLVPRQIVNIRKPGHRNNGCIYTTPWLVDIASCTRVSLINCISGDDFRVDGAQPPVTLSAPRRSPLGGYCCAKEIYGARSMFNPLTKGAPRDKIGIIPRCDVDICHGSLSQPNCRLYICYGYTLWEGGFKC